MSGHDNLYDLLVECGAASRRNIRSKKKRVRKKYLFTNRRQLETSPLPPACLAIQQLGTKEES